MSLYRFSEEFIGTEAIKGPNKTAQYLLDKGIELQQLIAQLFLGLVTKYSRTANVTTEKDVIWKNKIVNIKRFSCVCAYSAVFLNMSNIRIMKI